MCVFGSLDAERGKIAAIDLADETPVIQLPRRRNYRGIRGLMNLDAF